jgi:hypothetical protein
MTFRRQWIDIGGLGRLGDELGDSGELEAGSYVGWLKSDCESLDGFIVR